MTVQDMPDELEKGWMQAMNDQLRVSDADRSHVTGRLREHFAEGRLTYDELDERISAALNATTFGDLRCVLADLPEPVPAPLRAAQHPQPGWIGPPGRVAGAEGLGVIATALALGFVAILAAFTGGRLSGFMAVMLMFCLGSSLVRFAVLGQRCRSAKVAEMLVIVLVAAMVSGLFRSVYVSHIGSEIFNALFG
jgi:hypothetical protein